MSVIFSHPLGNANNRAALQGLFDAGLLLRFYTSVATYRGNIWGKISNTSVGKDFGRRTFPECLRSLTYQRPLRELCRLLAHRAKLTALTRHEVGLLSVDSVYRDLDRHVARSLRGSNASGVYAYEGGARDSFQSAQHLGMRCLYDLPIGYWRASRALLANENERWPEWINSISILKDSPEKLERIDDELNLADRVFVASSFTKRTLEDYAADVRQVSVVPYGFPPTGPPRDYLGLGNRKLKLLFVGGLNQRKGIADLFLVAKQLASDVELTVVGQGPVDQCKPLSESLKRHRWVPSLPHDGILRIMREHDVLVFPSLFEGFGLVITEAMSQGTPVLTTDRTAGPDIIESAKNGWLIEAGSTAILRSAIESLLNSPDQIAACGYQARETAARRSWVEYGTELASEVETSLSV